LATAWRVSASRRGLTIQTFSHGMRYETPRFSAKIVAIQSL
jgi:hypothetical protein